MPVLVHDTHAAPARGDLRSRPELPSDEGFLLRLFASTRPVELAMLGGPGASTGTLTPAQETFVRLQVLAQTRYWNTTYPRADRTIVLRDGAPVGRMIVDRTGSAILLVDIALSPEHRRRGIGTALVTPLLAEGARARREVRLQVARGNPAIRLYERLGFVRTSADEVRIAMTWRPLRA